MSQPPRPYTKRELSLRQATKRLLLNMLLCAVREAMYTSQCAMARSEREAARHWLRTDTAREIAKMGGVYCSHKLPDIVDLIEAGEFRMPRVSDL